MLLPALGDADLPGTAVRTLAAALAATIPVPEPLRVAEILLQGDGAYWSPAHWERLADGAVVCDGDHSLRTPGHPHALAITQALAVT